jgi:hypothetical protein
MNLWISANRSLVISSFVESGERCLVRMDHGSRVLGRRCPESRPSLRMPRMTCVTSCSGMLTPPLRANHGCMMDYLKLSRCFGYANGPTLAIGPTPTNATSTSYPGSSTTTSPARMVVSATLHPSAALFPKVQRLDKPQAPLFWWCSAKAGASFRHFGDGWRAQGPFGFAPGQALRLRERSLGESFRCAQDDTELAGICCGGLLTGGRWVW